MYTNHCHRVFTQLQLTNIYQYISIFKRADMLYHKLEFYGIYIKGKGLPQQAEVAQGVPGRLRHRIFLTFGTTRVVGRQPYAPAAFTPGEIPGTHF
jgi:hypothetical protein